MQSVVTLNVVMLNVVIPSVVAPLLKHLSHNFALKPVLASSLSHSFTILEKLFFSVTDEAAK